MVSLISYRQFQFGDERKIFRLTKLVWGYEVPKEDRWTKGWSWLHLANPAGISKIGLAEENNALIGQYPIILQIIKVGSEIVRGSQIVDTMTHPCNRECGVAGKLGEIILNGLKENGIALVIGFPNQQAYPFHMKRGWIDIGPFNTMLKPINAKKIAKKYSLKGSLLITLAAFNSIFNKLLNQKEIANSALTFRELYRFDRSITNLWESISHQYGIAIVRDDKYLNWRYIDNPTMKHSIYIAEESNEVRGYIVFGDKGIDNLHYGIIYDIIGPIRRIDIIRGLIAKAVKELKKRDVDIICCKMIADDAYFKGFLANGFIPSFNTKSRFIIYNPNNRFSDGFLRDSRNWFVQEGDLPGVY